jgi:hypothetical protein
MAKARHTRQLSRSQRAHKLIDAADELVTGWWAAGPDVPIDQAGTIEDTPFIWRTETMPDAATNDLPARMVRLTVSQTDEDARAVGQEPFAITVDLLLPRETQTRSQSGDRAMDGPPGRRDDPAGGQ